MSSNLVKELTKCAPRPPNSSVGAAVTLKPSLASIGIRRAALT